LIVGPVALIRQWEREIKTKVKAAHRLSVHMMHGGGRKLGWDELRNYDVVLTSYGTLAAEFGRMEVWEAKQKERGMDYAWSEEPLLSSHPR
jgi:SNF2 family DNA or RNA helicase